VLTPEILFAPTPRQSIDGVVATQNRVVLSLNDNVRGRVRVYARAASGWSAQPVDLPANATISTVAASDKSDQA